MFNRLLVGLSILLCSSIVSAQQQSFADTIATYFKDVKAATAKNENLWNYNTYAPILLVNPDSREIYANSPDSAGTLKKEGTIFTGKLPDSVTIANTSMRWSGVNWAVVMLPLPENKYVRLNLLTHELFHVAQPHLGFIPYNPDNSQLDQKEGRVYLRLELEALKAAVLTDSPSKMETHLADALTFRMYRYAIYPHADSTENLLELNEGLAEFTGVMMSGRNEQQMREHFVLSMNEFLKNPTFVRSFAYQTIPLYGYLLHKIKPGWNKNVTDKTDLTEYFLRAFHVSLPHDLKSAAAKITDEYDGQKIIAEETEREVKIEKQKAEYVQLFFKLPHLTINLRKMSIAFDPRNIIPLGDKGIVYPYLRVSDEWGILTATKGALIDPNWKEVTVTAPTQIEKEKVSGDGWTLDLQAGFTVQKDSATNNYILKKN